MWIMNCKLETVFPWHIWNHLGRTVRQIFMWFKPAFSEWVLSMTLQCVVIILLLLKWSMLLLIVFLKSWYTWQAIPTSESSVNMVQNQYAKNNLQAYNWLVCTAITPFQWMLKNMKCYNSHKTIGISCVHFTVDFFEK